MADMNTSFAGHDNDYFLLTKNLIVNRYLEILTYKSSIWKLGVGDLIDKLNEFLVCSVTS